MGEEGAAGDGGGEEQGGGQAAFDGNILLNDEVKFPQNNTMLMFFGRVKTSEEKYSFQEIESLGPLTGLGYFNIEKSTLTSMVSTALTYIIILVQFKMSTI